MPVNKTAAVKAANRTHGGDDPAIERHKDELFGTPQAADPTPPDKRYVGPGRVQLEWIGERGPLAEAKLAAAVQLKKIPAEVHEAWKKLHAFATTRIPGMTHHTMSVVRDGMSEDYTWGPYNFIVNVTIADADKILSGSFGHQFRVLNYDGPQPSDVSAIDRFLAPYVSAKTTAQVRAIVVETDVSEKLAGVEFVPDGNRGLMRTGQYAWTGKD